jgi:outer membrane beta-barrel protein
LVSGAPLYNPNVAVHIVEAKQFSDSRKREFVLYPATVQANGKFTQHAGSAAAFLWHIHENFALKAWGQYNWYSAESSFNAELVSSLRASAQAATSLLWVWGALGGVEVTPLYGKFAWYESTLGHFSFVVSGGAGFGATRLQLKAGDPANGTPPSYGQTTPRFLGSLGAGFRLQLGQRFAIRLEVTDVVYTARVDRVNGCDGPSLQALNIADSGNRPLSGVAVNPGCQIEPFVDPSTNKARLGDLSIANKLIEEGSSDVLNNLGFYAGFSVLF